MNRRSFLNESGVLFLVSALLPRMAIADSSPTVWRGLSYAEEMPDMLVSYLSKKLNTVASAWDEKRARIKTAAEVEARNTYVRNKVIKMMGGFPKKTPLGAVVVKAMQRDGYRIENVIFQSRPDFWVTGNLYVPTTGAGPFPGILSPCGHTRLGRMESEYQSAYLTLVKSGFVVLAYDPIGEGERRQYWDPQTNVIEVSGGQTYEHSMPGQLQLLMGENLTEYEVWDAIRGIDYLLTRPEVDPRKIGCAGQSGGGTFTKFISVVDERVQCAAIIEGGMVNRWPLKILPWEPIGMGDVEQELFPAAIYGVDEVDLHVAIAPRPVLTAIERDSSAFDQASQAVLARYRQLGATEKFATVVSDDPHGWTPKLRLATADWFCRWFYDRKGPRTEPRFKVEPAENLYCTPDGSIRYSRKGQTIFSLILSKQAYLPPSRRVAKTSAERHSFQEQIRTELRDLLHYRKSDQPLDVRHLVTTPREGYHIEKLQFLSEPGIYIPTWVYVPDNATGVLPTILYSNSKGMETAGMEFAGTEGTGQAYGILDTLVHAGNLVVAVDVRGIGETRPPHPNFDSHDVGNKFRQLFDLETTLTYMTWLMDESLLGMRVQDVVRSIDYVTTRKEADPERLHVIGQGEAGLWCLYAAALDPRIRGLISVESLLSYRSLTEVDRYLYDAGVFVPNVLLHFDLPQVAAAIADRPLVLIEPKDAMKKTVSADHAERVYQSARTFYESAGQGSQFRIESNCKNKATPEHYLSLLRGFHTA